MRFVVGFWVVAAVDVDVCGFFLEGRWVLVWLSQKVVGRVVW